MALVVHHGHGQEVVVRQQTGHLALVHVVRHADHALPVHGIAHHGPGPGQHDVPEGEDAEQDVRRVHHITVVGAFLVFHLAADVGYGLIHGHVLFEQDQLDVHDPGGGVRVKVEQVAQLFGIFLVQLAEQDVAVAFVQLVQHVGGVVRLHLGDDLGRHVGVEVLQDVHGHAAVQFGQRFGGVFRGHVAQGADLLFQRQVFQMVGKVRGMDELGIELVPFVKAEVRHGKAVLLIGGRAALLLLRSQRGRHGGKGRRGRRVQGSRLPAAGITLRGGVFRPRRDITAAGSLPVFLIVHTDTSFCPQLL